MTRLALSADTLVMALLDAPDWAEQVIGQAEIDALSAIAALQMMAKRGARTDLGSEILVQLGVPARPVSFNLLLDVAPSNATGALSSLADRTAIAFAKANGFQLATSSDALAAAAEAAGVSTRLLGRE